jgi:hypothetical protein
LADHRVAIECWVKDSNIRADAIACYPLTKEIVPAKFYSEKPDTSDWMETQAFGKKTNHYHERKAMREHAEYEAAERELEAAKRAEEKAEKEEQKRAAEREERMRPSFFQRLFAGRDHAYAALELIDKQE